MSKKPGRTKQETATALDAFRAVKEQLGTTQDWPAVSLIHAAADLLTVLEMCELALGGVFDRYRRAGEQPCEFERITLAEAALVLSLARGEVPPRVRRRPARGRKRAGRGRAA